MNLSVRFSLARRMSRWKLIECQKKCDCSRIPYATISYALFWADCKGFLSFFKYDFGGSWKT